MVAQLTVDSIAGGYGPVAVLFDVSFAIGEGEVFALVGRNGVGKTTTVRMLTGELHPQSGSIRFADRDIASLQEHRIARLGVGLVPEGRQIFPSLSVGEHLELAAWPSQSGGHWTQERVLALFPCLEARLKQFAGTLSGGEQQMLAIARALLINPRLLILDEATEGLAPVIRKEIWICLQSIAASGLSVLVIDKNIRALSRVAQKFAVVSKGRSVWSGTAAQFVDAKEVHQKYIGV